MKAHWRAAIVASGVALSTTSAIADVGNSPACVQSGTGRDSFCTVGGLRLHFVDWGGKGSPVILLTGLGNSARIYDDFAPLLARKHRVIAVTRRGYGASGTPADGDYSNAALVGDVIGLMDRLGIARASFIGHSIAGGELAALGADHPDRVDHLIYLDAAFDRTRALALMAAMPAMPPPPDADRATVARFARWRGKALGTTVTAVRTDLAQIMTKGASGFAPRTPASVGMKVLAGDIAAKPRWDSIPAPSLALYASRDVADQVPPNATPAQRAAFVSFSITTLRPWMLAAKADFERRSKCGVAVEVPGSTHHLFLDRPKWVANLIQRFLALPPSCDFPREIRSPAP